VKFSSQFLVDTLCSRFVSLFPFIQQAGKQPSKQAGRQASYRYNSKLASKEAHNNVGNEKANSKGQCGVLTIDCIAEPSRIPLFVG